MSNRVRPPQEVIDWFVAIGFEYKVNEQSIYTDRRDAPVHYFQSPGADGYELVSTILADDAIKIHAETVEPLSKKVERTFGERCENGHLRATQPCADCRKAKRPAPKTEEGKS